MPGMNNATGQELNELEHIRQSLTTLILTPVGSRIQRRDYGSVVPELIDHPLNQATVLRLYSATAAAIVKHEPRISVTSMTLSLNSSGSVEFNLVGNVGSDQLAAQIRLKESS